MPPATLDLTIDFPDASERIHELKENNTHFRKLFKAYSLVCKTLHRIEAEIETPSDMEVEKLKKERLALKDAIRELLLVE